MVRTRLFAVHRQERAKQKFSPDCIAGLATWRTFGAGWTRRLCELPFEAVQIGSHHERHRGLTSAAKGAAAGTVAGSVGAAVNGVGGLVLDIASEVSKWLFGSSV